MTTRWMFLIGLDFNAYMLWLRSIYENSLAISHLWLQVGCGRCLGMPSHRAFRSGCGWTRQVMHPVQST
eukprot:363544-Amphidinium_carterae.1